MNDSIITAAAADKFRREMATWITGMNARMTAVEGLVQDLKVDVDSLRRALRNDMLTLKDKNGHTNSRSVEVWYQEIERRLTRLETGRKEVGAMVKDTPTVEFIETRLLEEEP